MTTDVSEAVGPSHQLLLCQPFRSRMSSHSVARFLHHRELVFVSRRRIDVPRATSEPGGRHSGDGE